MAMMKWPVRLCVSASVPPIMPRMSVAMIWPAPAVRRERPPHRGRDGDPVEQRDPAQSEAAMNRAGNNVAQPFPGVPWLSLTGETPRVGMRQGSGREDRFAVANVPPGVRIAKE